MTYTLIIAGISAYVATSGIYWLPGLSVDLIANYKLALFVSVVCFGLIKFRIPSGTHLKIYLLLFVCALVAFLTESLASDTSNAIKSASDFIAPLLWLASLCSLPTRTTNTFLSLAPWLVGIAVGMLAYPFLVATGFAPDLPVPSELSGISDTLMLRETTGNSGFTASRTNFGAIAAPTTTLLIALVLHNRPNKLAIAAVGILALGALLSMIVAGSRGGALAFIITLGYLSYSARGKKIARIILISLLSTVVIYTGAISMLPDTFTRNTDAKGGVYDQINTLSTGRLETDIGAIIKWMDSPIIGVGKERAHILTANYGERSIHNVWLRYLAQGGIIQFTFILWLTALLIRETRKRKRNSEETAHSVKTTEFRSDAIITVSFILAMLEPSVIFGSFNANAPFWTSIWLLLNHYPTVTHRNTGHHLKPLESSRQYQT